MKSPARSAVLVSLLAGLSLTCAPGVQAKTVTLWPGVFEADAPPGAEYHLGEDSITASDYGITFTAPLRLPAGSTLNRAFFSWKGDFTASVTCKLMRKPFNGYAETVASTSFGALYAYPWTELDLTFTGVGQVVRKGYRYYVTVQLSPGWGSTFGGMRIVYTPPAQ